MNDIKQSLIDEIDIRFQELQKFDPDSDEYGKASKCVIQLYDRYMDEQKLEHERNKLEFEKIQFKAKEAEKEEAKKTELQNQHRDELKYKVEKILDICKIAVNAAGIVGTIVGVVINVKAADRGRRELLLFETEGCVTSKSGQMGYIPKPKC